MRTAAAEFVISLSPEQRSAAVAAFDVADHQEWTYLPGPRPGLALADMSDAQRALAMRLLDTGLSDRGQADARRVMELEATLRQLEQDAGESGWTGRDPHFFWFRILGDPGNGSPWAWRANGHHLAVHVTLVGDELAATPQFFGANPAKVPHTGFRTLPIEEDLARDLLATFDREQAAIAVSGPIAPGDILTRRDPVADPALIPVGLTHAQMRAPQRDLLGQLVRQYLERVTPEVSDLSWRTVTEAGLDTVRFTWAGSDRRGEGHYYAVTGPTFLLEYDNTQSNANHVHTVWRDLRNDWGADVLAQHYAAHQHG
jgi:hypothetical protein